MLHKKLLFRIFFLLFCLLQKQASYASHIFGGELLYTCINDTTYKLSLTFYGDCSAYSAIFHSLDDAQPLIYIYNNGNLYDTVRLQPDSIEIDVSPVCPQYIDSTTCHSGTLPGVKKFIYTLTVIIPAASAKWSFIFKGDMGSSNAAGRSYNITNIISPGTSLMQLEADLNNTISHNSSPQYSTNPTPFYCISLPEQYNQGAIDPDGDSLAFQLVQAYDGQSGSPVAYAYPYTFITPMATNTGNFLFTGLNGEMDFTPNTSQDALIVIQVAEYRGGVQVGSSEREMTFIVTGNCSGTPPTLNITSIYGGLPDNNIINICEGTPRLSFLLSLTNPEGDSTHLTYRNLPTGATLDTLDNGTSYSSAGFNWNTGAVAPGLYTFYVTLKNNHCPISNTSTIAYTIHIAQTPTITDTLLAPTDCIHQALMQYNLTDGFFPRMVYIVQGPDTVRTYMDSTGKIIDSLPAGEYIAIVSSDSLCTFSIMFSIADSGSIPLIPLYFSLCDSSPAQPLYFPPVAATAQVYWYTAGGTPLPGSPTPETNTPGIYCWYVTEHYKTCNSLPDTVTATVWSLPSPHIENVPATICYGDTLYLSATGNAQYTWSPQSATYMSSNNILYTIALAPQTFTVTAIDTNGCTDTETVAYTNIQPCCNFSYPNAFTPNDDGRNDGFRIITYGNMIAYQLSVYNRWGNKVFYSEDPSEYWNGKNYRSGAPCDEDTYYYYFKGQCLTGKSEEHKGSITLIR